MTISSALFTCLAIETATELPSIALLRGDTLAVRQARGMRAPSSCIFEWVKELLAETQTSFGELDCIAFGSGPGSFTGVRVAVALAQALGYARGLPLCPVSTLAALAAGALEAGTADSVACCLDARMGQVYFGTYRRDTEIGVHALAPDALLNPDEVNLPGQEAYVAAGPGWLAHPHLALRLGARLAGVESEQLPSAADVARLARPRFLLGRLVSPAAALPNYLRDRVASMAKNRDRPEGTNR